MQIIKTEIIKVSANEWEALTLSQEIMEGLMRESDNPNVRMVANKVLDGIGHLYNYIQEEEIE